MAALIDGMNQDLGKDVRDISVYSLNSALDTAVRASSAQYDDPDIIARLQIRLEESIGTETGRPQKRWLAAGSSHTLWQYVIKDRTGFTAVEVAFVMCAQLGGRDSRRLVACAISSLRKQIRRFQCCEAFGMSMLL